MYTYLHSVSGLHIVATWISFLERPCRRRRDGRSGWRSHTCVREQSHFTCLCDSKEVLSVSSLLVLLPLGSRSCQAAPFPPPVSPPPVFPARSRQFPGFSFHFTLPSSSPGLPFHAPFFPGTSLSTRLTSLVVYLESSITCT